MHNYEKTAFLKFFITYFVSVAVLILTAGHFYYVQMEAHYLKAEEFSLIEYARHIKTQQSLQAYKKGYHYKFVTLKDKHIDIRNFKVEQKELSKILPMHSTHDYLVVYKQKQHLLDELWELKKMVIGVQIFLLFVFASISYIMAKTALRPLQESIIKLDKFAKDLIHDLNTPVTSIKLNMKLIEKLPQLQDNKALMRLNRSVYDISELHENLTLLLQEETFQVENIDICKVAEDVVVVYKAIYTDLTFEMECCNFMAKANANALKQIVQNIISNACKYNKTNGFVKVYTDKNTLCIEDSGKGIDEPQKIFQRHYSAEHSSGIGLDIVRRLAEAMQIEIEVKTSQEGSCFQLRFRS